jgi:lipoyl(octanoyl) transferase
VDLWHLWVDDVPRPGFLNMAVDETLLRLAETEGARVLRLYRWSPPCLSFGRHEPARRRYRRDRIAERGLDTVRRPTGGRAVWHDAELTYAVAAPAATFGTRAETYLAIHRTLACALARLGLATSLAPAPVRAAGPDAGACFASPAGGEVLVGARKVIGSAQLRGRTAFLQHGSVLLDGDQGVVADVSLGAAPPGGEGALAPLLGRPVAFAEVAEAVAAAARTWGNWRPIHRGDAILELAASAADGYRSDAWTWER